MVGTVVQTRMEEKRKGLRIAIAVAVGFTAGVAAGSIIPFFGPVFAAQFLISDDRPVPLGKTLAMVVILFAVGSAMEFVVAVLGARPSVLLPVLGLIYFACFYLAAIGKAGAAIFPVLVLAIMIPLLGILNRDLGESASMLLVKGVLVGAALTWLSHALVPARSGAGLALVRPEVSDRPFGVAACCAVILLIIMVICLSYDPFSTALVIPITVASLLLQLDVLSSARTSVGLVAVNFLGGVLACLAFTIVDARQSLILLFLIVFLAGLIMGGKSTAPVPASKLYAGALTIFLMVLGLGISPLPGSAGETFTSRLSNIVIAIAYTLLLAPLLWPSRNGGSRRHEPHAGSR